MKHKIQRYYSRCLNVLIAFAAISACTSVLRLLFRVTQDRGVQLPSMETSLFDLSQDVFAGSREPRKNVAVAVAVTITNEVHEKYGVHHIDMASSLAESVERWRDDSEFSIDLIAFVRPEFHLIRSKLKAFGFRVIEKDLPVTLSEIKPGKYRSRVDKSGCCGISEFIKLYAFTLTDYFRVIHVDIDVFFTGNLDELVNMPQHYDLMYTNSTLRGELLSGGFIVVKPSMKAFQEILQIVRSGDFHYDGKGWGDSGIGRSWGGETVQGILPYYYLKFFPSHENGAATSLRLDRCVYNIQGGKECLNADTSLVKVVHMTVCQKPLKCRAMRHVPLCAWMHDMWWDLSLSFQDRLGVPRNSRCKYSDKEGYLPINVTASKHI